ncbi:MAG: YcxB family protein [Butyricicoccus sp.]|nr:YcxB family protein [Butyricicoccus sp.]
MFLFQISGYNDPALDMEVPELFQQRLESHSRHAVPSLWKATDKLNSYAAKGTNQKAWRARYRVYGVLLLALGIFAIVPGLTEPRIPSLIVAGAFAIVAGLLELCLARQKKPLPVPASCQKQARQFLAGRRAVDWSKAAVKVCFDENGMAVSDEEKKEAVPYGKMSGLFETENLWLLTYDNEKALLLQKRDLISGDASEFSPCLHSRLAENP